MEQEQTTKQRFTRFTKTQGALALFSFVFSLFFAGAVFSQATIPQLQMDPYNSNVMNQVYAQSYFLNSTQAWMDQVLRQKGLFRAQWEAEADRTIYDYVSGINTSDAYNDLNAHKDSALKQLISQKMEALHTWESRANLDFLRNRDEFLTKIETNVYNKAYLDRLGAQTQSMQLLLGNQRIEELQSNISSAASNWNANFNQSYQSGLNDFANTLGNIEDEYGNFLTSLDNSEATFQDNLTTIDSYKTVVKNAIKGIVGEFQTMLDKPCNQANPCLYRQANNGGLNGAGQTMSALVTSLNEVLNDNSLNPTNILTTISALINNFLSSQTNSAYLTYTDYSNQISTVQTTWPPANPYGVGYGQQYINDINNGVFTFDHTSADQRSHWSRDTNGLFSGIDNANVQAVVQAIVAGRGNLTALQPSSSQV
ncbi:TIGR04388 family protein [Leptospira ilyithenensis]|uniref:TIGR04388 family protein n=1 Tax=Leptospira ilyithenensis TaxID=2484901 RepID=A0A4R9LN80_9LEPT|nr:TIGR04388 family protein [Leptospira ilyithenensis]TGN10201.1 TIGR04388 family protein [Leptospira ilyithenensis]